MLIHLCIGEKCEYGWQTLISITCASRNLSVTIIDFLCNFFLIYAPLVPLQVVECMGQNKKSRLDAVGFHECLNREILRSAS